MVSSAKRSSNMRARTHERRIEYTSLPPTLWLSRSMTSATSPAGVTREPVGTSENAHTVLVHHQLEAREHRRTNTQTQDYINWSTPRLHFHISQLCYVQYNKNPRLLTSNRQSPPLQKKTLLSFDRREFMNCACVMRTVSVYICWHS